MEMLVSDNFGYVHNIHIKFPLRLKREGTVHSINFNLFVPANKQGPP